MGAQEGMIYVGHCLSVDGLDSLFGDPCQAILQKELLVWYDMGMIVDIEVGMGCAPIARE